MTRIPIHGPVRLADWPALYEFACAAMSTLQQTGIAPKDRGAISGESSAVFIEDNGTAAVAVFYQAGQGRVWLDLLFVTPHARRKGYGRALIRRLESVARDAGMRKIMFGTHEQNEPMRRLGQACGYLTQSVTLGRSIEQAPLGAGLA